MEHKEHYQRHSLRNRTYIVGANKILLLTVPVVSKNSSKTLIENIKIATNNWKKKHINSIQSYYGSAPFFIHYFEDLKKIINKNHIFLIDLNYDLLTYILVELQINKEIKKTKSYIHNYSNKFIDQRNSIKIDMNTKKYQPFGYVNSINNLSIIDLLFNVGPNAKKYIYPEK
tara:strand:+ start:100 stop:615 length:516 start_codon:yes stop_codon:yes gene_type:complete